MGSSMESILVVIDQKIDALDFSSVFHFD